MLNIRATLLAAAILALPVPSARAVCIPADLDGLSGDVHIRAQIVAVPDAARPYAIVRCSVSGPRSSEYLVPLTVPADSARQATPDESWDALWTATAPYAIERLTPSAGDEERATYDLDPRVIARLGHEAVGTLSATVAAAELDAAGDLLPEATVGLLRYTVDPGAMSGTEEAWLPAVRVSLGLAEDGTPLLPVLPIGRRAGATATVTYDTAIVFLGTDRYYALRGFDLWEAIERPGGGIADSAARVAPEPVLAIPALLRTHNVHRRDFATHYADRIAEVVGDLESPVAVLQYAGSIGEPGRTLPRPPLFASHSGANRAVRVRLDNSSGRPLGIVEVAPMLFRSLWVSLPDAPDVVLAPPDQVELSDESLLFTFGAELPSQLTPSLVGESLEENAAVIGACDPGTGAPLYADVQIAVEPGGTALAAFVGVDDWAVGQCLVDAFADMFFPLATGPPIAIRFPIQFGPQ